MRPSSVLRDLADQNHPAGLVFHQGVQLSKLYVWLGAGFVVRVEGGNTDNMGEAKKVGLLAYIRHWIGSYI